MTLKVSELMSVDYETVDKDQILSDALKLMRKKDISRLIVTEDSKVVGVLSFRDVADRLGTGRTDGISSKTLRISSAMSYPIIPIEPSADIKEAAKLMIAKGISSLVVMENDECKGLLTKFDLLETYKDCKSLLVQDIMTKDTYSITPNERVLSARQIMMNNKFSVLPIVNDDGELTGVVDDEQLADALAKFRDSIPIKHQKNKLHEFFVGQVMRRDLTTINPESPVCDLVDLFKETRSKGIIVVNEINNIEGIVTVTDVANAIGEGRN
ncbi:MAG: CBS domain-containing protein [Candidatus Heimdallarchaeota archaeon]|nr:CBS domain-containing protein [Candidatus Heimdallarchaeota archaeon]